MRGLLAAVALALLPIAPALAQALAPAPPVQQTAEVHGIRIRYYDLGERTAPVVLLLHGLGDRAANHLGTAAVLARSFRVIAPDQVGHGASDKPALSYRIRTFSDFDKGLLDALGVARAHVVGESLGGWIAADLVLRYPQSFDRLALVDPAGVKTPGQPLTRGDIPDELYVSSVSDERALLRRIFFHKEIVTDAMVEAAFREHLQSGDAPVIASVLEGLLHSDEWLNDRAADIEVPTLIVWGRQDQLLSPAGAEVLHAAIEGSRVVMLDDCGHSPAADSPAAFHAALLDFLTGR